MATLRWTPDAADDLEQIAKYLGQRERSPAAATRVIRGIYAKCQQFAKQPKMGTKPEQVRRPKVRFFRYKSYLVFYEPIHDGIEILHVVHGSRDYLTLFETEAEESDEDKRTDRIPTRHPLSRR